jgi:hypothetical protein
MSMTKDAKGAYPRIYCDQNDRMTEHRYLPTNGTTDDLAALGLTLESAVGLRFELAMRDDDENGRPGDIIGNGTVVIDPEFGFLLEVDEDGFEWRPRPGE